MSFTPITITFEKGMFVGEFITTSPYDNIDADMTARELHRLDDAERGRLAIMAAHALIAANPAAPDKASMVLALRQNEDFQEFVRVANVLYDSVDDASKQDIGNAFVGILGSRLANIMTGKTQVPGLDIPERLAADSFIDAIFEHMVAAARDTALEMGIGDPKVFGRIRR